MKPIEALKSARNTYICHQVNRVRLPILKKTALSAAISPSTDVYKRSAFASSWRRWQKDWS